MNFEKLIDRMKKRSWRKSCVIRERMNYALMGNCFLFFCVSFYAQKSYTWVGFYAAHNQHDHMGNITSEWVEKRGKVLFDENFVLKALLDLFKNVAISMHNLIEFRLIKFCRLLREQSASKLADLTFQIKQSFHYCFQELYVVFHIIETIMHTT